MKKNTLLHHKKHAKKLNNSQKQKTESPQFLSQNPQSSAKFSLLEISQQNSKVNQLKHMNLKQNSHIRSYSTDHFSMKYKMNDNNFQNQYQQNSFNQQLKNKNLTKSVALKSTFSNQMKRKYINHLYQTSYSSFFPKNSKQKYQDHKEQKFRKTSYFPLAVHQQKSNQNINHIFKSTPSKQILLFLKKTGLSKDVGLPQKSSKQDNNITQQKKSRKKSIFNIRSMIQKNQQNFTGLSGKPVVISPQKSLFSTKRSSPDFIPQGQIHASNKNSIMLRLKMRIKRSSMSNM